MFVVGAEKRVIHPIHFSDCPHTEVSEFKTLTQKNRKFTYLPTALPLVCYKGPANTQYMLTGVFSLIRTLLMMSWACTDCEQMTFNRPSN